MALPWLGFLFGAVMAVLCKRQFEEVIAVSIETGIQNTGLAIGVVKVSVAWYFNEGLRFRVWVMWEKYLDWICSFRSIFEERLMHNAKKNGGKNKLEMKRLNLLISPAVRPPEILSSG